MESAGFHYKLHIPVGSPDCAVVLLHGSGRTEEDLASFGRAVFPNGILYAPRGVVPWENGFAFFRRKPDRQLDIDDLKHQAGGLCRFIEFVFQQTGQRPFLVGYSNGAIIAAETICQNRHLSRGAILLRPLSPAITSIFRSSPDILRSCWQVHMMSGGIAMMRPIWPINFRLRARMWYWRHSTQAMAGQQTRQTSGCPGNGYFSVRDNTPL
ncbi:hypothetical protein SAMN05216595_4581 [Rhizobium sp. AN6A]|nr:hypothetical protein SAMN05216595_4581 [Rhizobium sp. AN6A]